MFINLWIPRAKILGKFSGSKNFCIFFKSNIIKPKLILWLILCHLFLTESLNEIKKFLTKNNQIFY